MNRLTVLVLFSVLFLSCGPEEVPLEKTGPNGETWTLVWNDEFDYEGEPDTTKWTYDTGAHGWGNSEVQNYTADRANSYVDKGVLTIKAIREGKYSWSSARLKTEDLASWQYGRVEIRAKQPEGVGTWSALWMYPAEEVYGAWPKSGEIDIMELVGFNPGVIHGTIHTASYNHIQGTHQQGTTYFEDAAEKFHIYAIEWDEDQLRWYVDDELFFQFDRNEDETYREWPFDHPYYLIMNLSIGGLWGGKEGIDKEMDEAELVVDYVRVYQQKGVLSE